LMMDEYRADLNILARALLVSAAGECSPRLSTLDAFPLPAIPLVVFCCVLCQSRASFGEHP